MLTPLLTTPLSEWPLARIRSCFSSQEVGLQIRSLEGHSGDARHRNVIERAGSSIVGGARVCGVEVVVVSHLGSQTDSDVCYQKCRKKVQMFSWWSKGQDEQQPRQNPSWFGRGILLNRICFVYIYIYVCLLFLLGAWFHSCHRFVGMCILLYILYHRTVLRKLYFIYSMSSNEQFQRPLDQISVKEDFEETVFFPYASKLLIHFTKWTSIHWDFKKTNSMCVMNQPRKSAPFVSMAMVPGQLSEFGGWFWILGSHMFPSEDGRTRENIRCNHRMWNYVTWYS